jgi:hypothetical protein
VPLEPAQLLHPESKTAHPERFMAITPLDAKNYWESLARPSTLEVIPVRELPADPRRVVSLADAAKAAKDFIIMRTLPGSVRAFCSRPDVAAALRQRAIQPESDQPWLIVAKVTADGKPGVLIRDAAGKHLLQLKVDGSQHLDVLRRIT